MNSLSNILSQINQCKFQIDILKTQFEEKDRTRQLFLTQYTYWVNRLRHYENLLNQYGRSIKVYRIKFSQSGEKYEVIYPGVEEVEIIPLILNRHPDANNITYQLIPVGTPTKI